MTDQPSIGDKLTFFALITLEKPISLLPTSCMWRFGSVLGRIAHRFAKKRRAILQANLKIVNPETSDLELTKLSQELFRKSLGNLASTMNTDCISSKKIRQLVTINDQEQVEVLDNDKACKFLKAGVTLPLFGKETSITPLPVILAQNYDCPILPVTIKTTAPGKWDLDFEKPFHLAKELDKTEATKLLIPIMEKIMKEHCSDIFWLHDRWKVKRSL